jgi:hypothetical protein
LADTVVLVGLPVVTEKNSTNLVRGPSSTAACLEDRCFSLSMGLMADWKHQGSLGHHVTWPIVMQSDRGRKGRLRQLRSPTSLHNYGLFIRAENNAQPSSLLNSPRRLRSAEPRSPPTVGLTNPCRPDPERGLKTTRGTLKPNPLVRAV